MKFKIWANSLEDKSKQEIIDECIELYKGKEKLRKEKESK